MADEMRFECPSCHSDNIQSFQVAFKGGVSTSTSTTTGLGVSRGIGVGVATTSTTNMNALASEVAPPPQKGSVGRFILLWFGTGVLALIVMVSIGDTIGKILGFAGLLYACYDAYRSYQWNHNVWPKLMDEWNHSYICLRCGNKFKL